MADFPLTRSRALVLVAAAIVVLLVGARLLERGQPAAIPAPIVPAAAPPVGAASEVVVDVVGAVRKPGVYELREGARIGDAVRKAGGAVRKADLAAINLAAPLADGQQVVVPRRGAGGVAAPGAAAPQGPVHLNTATVEQLDALPGVGPVTAQRIIDFRTEHGPFESVDGLDAVPGIGPARMDTLRKLVTP